MSEKFLKDSDIFSDQVDSPIADESLATKQTTSDSTATDSGLTAKSKGYEERVDQSVSSLGLPKNIVGIDVSATGGIGDMFAPENLRVSQDYVEQANVEQIIGTISVRKPDKQEFVRVRPGVEWQLPVAVIEDNVDRECWIVAPSLVPEVANETSFVLLRLAINRSGVHFLWPLKISKDGKRNTWNQSAMVAAENAVTRWVRILSDRGASQYRILAEKDVSAEPEWSDMTFQKILELAFKDRIIADYNHPYLKQLRGEA